MSTPITPERLAYIEAHHAEYATAHPPIWREAEEERAELLAEVKRLQGELTALKLAHGPHDHDHLPTTNEVRNKTLELAALTAEDTRLIAPGPIGPAWDAGWNEACKTAARFIRKRMEP